MTRRFAHKPSRADGLAAAKRLAVSARVLPTASTLVRLFGLRQPQAELVIREAEAARGNAR